MRLRIMVLLAAGLPVLLATVMAAVPASALAPEGQENFAKQGQTAGLSTAQITELQTTVDGYLGKLGGRQVALNQIDLNGDATIYVALSGEDHPRKLPSAFGVQATDPDCTPRADFQHFCAYRLTNFGGDQIDFSRCGIYTLPWAGNGSWDNNLSGGARVRFYGSFSSVDPLFITPPAPSWDTSFDWTPVFAIRIC
jgi:hypothetical protein